MRTHAHSYAGLAAQFTSNTRTAMGLMDGPHWRRTTSAETLSMADVAPDDKVISGAIHVIAGHRLRGCDANGLADPYVIIRRTPVRVGWDGL